MKLTSMLCAVALCAAMFVAACGNSSAAQSAGDVTKNDVLSIRDGKFYLHGKRFAEFSFDKFDLSTQLYTLLKNGKGDTQEYRDMVASQDQSLGELHALGFDAIRFFGAPFAWESREFYNDPEKRTTVFYRALDTALDLCDKDHIQVVYDLGAGDFTDKKYVAGRMDYGEEHLRDLVANSNSRSRQEMYRYLDDIVNRYKNRKTILMWEISNEMTLTADISPENRIFEGQRMPSLLEVARFYDDVAKRIKSNDPLRLVNNGGATLRTSQWNQYTNHNWNRDTVEEQGKALALLYAHSAVDVIDIHYGNNNKGSIYVVKGPNGEDARMNVRRYMEAAASIGKPLMLGECALDEVAHDDSARSKKVYEETPDYIDSLWDPNAAKWVKILCDEVVDAGPQFVMWWDYGSDRPQENKAPSWNVKKGKTDAVLAIIVDANKRLKAKLGAE